MFKLNDDLRECMQFVLKFYDATDRKFMHNLYQETQLRLNVELEN